MNYAAILTQTSDRFWKFWHIETWEQLLQMV